MLPEVQSISRNRHSGSTRSKGHINVFVQNRHSSKKVSVVPSPEMNSHPLVQHMYGHERRIPISPSAATLRQRRHHRLSPNHYVVSSQESNHYGFNYITKDYGKGKLNLPCVTCPQDQTIYVDQRKGCAKVTLPPLKYCSSLTHLPGRIHLAVTAGPKRGSKVKPGNYLMKLHILKGGLHIKTCTFRLHVQEPPCSSSHVQAPKHGIGECTNGTKTSSCTFTCFPGYVITGDSKIFCRNGKWYGRRPKCIEMKEKPKERLQCLPPKDPDNGAVYCDGSQTFFPGTVCKTFCDEGYEALENSVIMCVGNKWNQTGKLKCVSVQCGDLPAAVGPGKWKCLNEKTETSTRGDTIPNGKKYLKGSVCNYQCNSGYIVPSPFLNSTSIECQAPQWNSTDIPRCYKQTLPKFYCQDEEQITQDGYSLIKLPKAVSSHGNTVLLECKYSGQLQTGTYLNFCQATDPYLRTTANCTYTINIKTPECSAPEKTKNGHIKCISPTGKGFPVHTFCQYFCNAGFVIPTSYFVHGIQKCLDTLKWNSTVIPPCQSAIKPKVKEGLCKNINISINGTEPIQIPIPKFYTSNGLEAVVKCTISKLSREGQHENLCKAFDPELRTEATCSYVVDVIQPTTGEFRGQKCDALSAPENGFITCATRSPKIICNVECKENHMFPPNLTLLHIGEISCDPSIGIWDFQKKYGIKEMPDCLRELPTTSLQLPIRLNVSIDNCSDLKQLNWTMTAIREGLVERMTNTCKIINCLDFSHKCSEEKQTATLHTVWKLQISFNPEDYEYIYDVPEAENALEEALLEAQQIFSLDSTFLRKVNKTGAQLQSFQQGLYVLVCQESGFSADPITYKCYECPAGTYENDGQCISCPANHFQKMTGQTNCKPCPKGTMSNSSATDCTMKCPCQSGGSCEQTSNKCNCPPNFTGDHCEKRKCPGVYEKWFCLNNSTCYLNGSNMECDCAPGYEGERCQIKVEQ